jgi:hypothetical protein
VLGIFWRRANTKGALCTFIFGSIFGALRFILELAFKGTPELKSNWFLKIFVGSNFLHFGFVSFVICCFILVVVSLLSEKPTIDPDTLAKITWEWKRPRWCPSRGSYERMADNKEEEIEKNRVELDPEHEETQLLSLSDTPLKEKIHKYNWVAATLLIGGVVTLIIVFR